MSDNQRPNGRPGNRPAGEKPSGKHFRNQRPGQGQRRGERPATSGAGRPKGANRTDDRNGGNRAVRAERGSGEGARGVDERRPRRFDGNGESGAKSFGGKKPRNFDRSRRADGPASEGRKAAGFNDRREKGGSKPFSGEGREGRRTERHGAKRPPRNAETAGDRSSERVPTGYAGELAPRKTSRKSKASPARAAALEALGQVRERNAFAQDVIAHTIDCSHMKPEDRAFATRLVLGVTSSWGVLDEVINKFLDDPRDISPSVRDALRLSVYEIVFLGKHPHAAVDQGVELVKSVAPPAAGLANAVLRKVVRDRAEFPYGDPATDIDALARACAFPGWLARVLVNDLGPEAAVALMRASNEQAPVFVAVNGAKGGMDIVLRGFEKAGEPVEPVAIDGVEVPGCLRVLDPRALLLPEAKRLLGTGRILVSDAASQFVASSILPDDKPASFLEIGAGRATKTILIQGDAARRFGSQIGEYVTLDNKEFKTKLLLKRTKEYGIRVSEALTGDALDLSAVLGQRTFDMVFLDAPCSGLGTLRRHPEIRWRIGPADIIGFARTQLAMLRQAAAHVAPGGTLAYATCTVTRAEDNAVVKAFLDSDEGRDFTLTPIAGASCIATRLVPEPRRENAQDRRVLTATEPSGDFDPEKGNANRFDDALALMGSPDAHFAVRFVRRGVDGTEQSEQS